MSASHQARRATVDDLPQLRTLWSRANLDPLVLEKRLTEFQVVEGNGIVAAIGIHIASLQGRIHSEAMANPAQREELEPVLWARIQSIARNHGLERLWIESSALLREDRGFSPAAEHHLKRLPPVFGAGKAWQVIQLKEETAARLSAEQELELFAQAQKQNTETLMRQARVFKMIAYCLMWLVVAAMIALVIIAARHHGDFKGLPQSPPPARE